jgi:hypothetical protein
MKRKSILVGVLVLGLLLAVAVGMTQAQEPEFPDGEFGLESVNAVAASVSGRIPIQGRLTDASGTPLDGTYSIQFSLYDVSSEGTALCSDTNSVTVDNGLFYSEILGNCSGVAEGQQLYLGITVGTDPEMTPRKAIYPVPYASSLMPGAVISTTGYPALHVESTSTSGRALRAYASATSGTNFAVVGASKSPDGYAGYF